MKYSCIGCSQDFTASELIICEDAHMDVFDDPTPMGPLCAGCADSHQLVAHDGELRNCVN